MRPTSRKISTPIHSPDNRKISVIIPAAGYGSRMKSYGPKSLINIKNDLSIIDNQLRFVFKYFYEPEVTVVAGYDFRKVENRLKNRPVNIIENKNWEHSNVVSSIHLGLKESSSDNVLIIYGDLVFNAWALKAPFGTYSMLLIDKFGLMKPEEVGCVCVNNFVVSMMYDLSNKWAQIGYFTGNELDIFCDLCSKAENENKFGFEMINTTINLGGAFVPYSPPRMKITDIDSSKDLNKVSAIL